MKFLLKKKKNLKTEMNLYSIKSIHLKTSKGKKEKKWTNVPVQLQQPKKIKVSVRSGEDALLPGSLGLLGWRSKEITRKEEDKKNIKNKSGIKMGWNWKWEA